MSDNFTRISINPEPTALVVQLNTRTVAVLLLMNLLTTLLLVGAGGYFLSRLESAQEKLQKTVATGQNELTLQVADLKKSTEAIDCRLIYINQPIYKGDAGKMNRP